jgi:hypothetical protein
VERTSYPDGVDPEDVDSVLRGVSAGAFGPPAVTADSHQNAGRVTDLWHLLAAIQHVLPRPAVVYLEGTNIDDEVRTFLDERSIPPGRDDLWVTTWPRPEGFHVPLNDANMDDLCRLVKSQTRAWRPFPFGGICNHVVVYRGDDILLAAYDVGSEVTLSRDLPTATVERFQQVACAT